MSKIRIELDQPEAYPGDTVTAKVIVAFDKPTKVRGINAEVYGFEKTEAKYTTTETKSDGTSRTVSKTATEYVDILKKNILLFGDERKNFFFRLGDSAATWFGGGDHELLEGERSFDIEFTIPENAPTTCKGKICEVTYTIAVAVDVPIKMDWHETETVIVKPRPVEFYETEPVHIIFPDQTGRSIWDKAFGKDVRLNLAVDRDTLSIGEAAMAILTVETPEPLTVKKITVTLVGLESTVAQGRSDSSNYQFEICEIGSPGVISNESVHEFDFRVPELDAPFSQTGRNFSITWSFDVQLYIPWAKDPVISTPINILPMPSGGELNRNKNEKLTKLD